MNRLRVLIRGHRRLALVLLLLAFCVKAAIPAGYMASVSPDRVVTVSICADASGGLRHMQMTIPGKNDGSGAAKSAKADGQCAFSGLAQAAVVGADAILLALAFAVILSLGFAPAARWPISAIAHLRPPLRGPPATA